MPYYESGYLDPLHIIWRRGTAGDPYTDRVEYIVVANQTIILSEIPDKVTRVKITGLTEVSYDKIDTLKLQPNQFYVNYSTGVVQFHESMEAVTVTAIYKGRGFIQYPSDRIYHRDKLNNVVKSLSSIIDESAKKIDEAEIKIKEIENVIGEAEEVIGEANTAIDNANKATEESKVATDKALDAYETTRLVFKKYVQTYDDIATTYPNPEVGWTTQVYDTGIRYRWDGIEWVEIEGLGGNVPLASEDVDGLLSKEDFVKLRDISNDVDVRTIVFVCPDNIEGGVQKPTIRFTHNGQIVDILAYVTTVGTSPLPIEIEYSDSIGSTTWNKLTQGAIVIQPESYESGEYVLNTDVVELGTFFRLNVPSYTVDALNLHVEIMIKIN